MLLVLNTVEAVTNDQRTRDDQSQEKCPFDVDVFHLVTVTLTPGVVTGPTVIGGTFTVDGIGGSSGSVLTGDTGGTVPPPAFGGLTALGGGGVNGEERKMGRDTGALRRGATDRGRDGNVTRGAGDGVERGVVSVDVTVDVELWIMIGGTTVRSVVNPEKQALWGSLG